MIKFTKAGGHGPGSTERHAFVGGNRYGVYQDEEGRWRVELDPVNSKSYLTIAVRSSLSAALRSARRDAARRYGVSSALARYTKRKRSYGRK